MRNLRVRNIQWGAGAFCALVGILMLISPHRFGYLSGTNINDYMQVWGIFLLGGGCLLLSIPFLAPPRWLVFVAHLLCSLLLLAFIAAEVYYRPFDEVALRLANYGLLALGLLAPLPFLRRTNHMQAERDRNGQYLSGDLLLLLLGLALVINGGIVIAQPSLLSSQLNFPVWPGALLSLSVLACLSGLGLAAIQLQPVRASAWIKSFWLLVLSSTHLAAAFCYLAFAALLASPTGASLGFNLGFGLSLAFIPWLTPKMSASAVASLQARLALVLILVLELPLIFSVSWISSQEETSVLEEARVNLQYQASMMADGISDYVNLHRDILKGMAADPSLMQANQLDQIRLLQGYKDAYPDTAAFSLFDTQGNPIASTSSKVMQTSAESYPFFELARQTRQPSMDLIFSPIFQLPVLALSQPLYDDVGSFKGIIALSLPSDRIVNQLKAVPPASEAMAYLVNVQGKTVAHPDLALMNAFADLSALPPVKAFLGRDESSGSFRFHKSQGEYLGSYALIPDLSWGVIIERPVSDVLAGVYAGRDTALMFLVVFIPLSVILGLLLAERLTAPLLDMRQAAAEMAEGDITRPLPRTMFIEINQLSEVFGAMRHKLALRTQEREAALDELKTANENLERRVSERTREIEQERARLTAIINAAPEGITVVDAQNRILLINPAAEQIYEHTASTGEPVSAHDSLELHRADGTPYDLLDLPLSRSAMNGESFNNLEMAVKTIDGKLRPLLVNTAPIYDEQERITGAVGVFQDITRLKELENENTRQRLLLQSIFEADPAGFAVIVRYEDGPCIELCNPAYRQITPHPETDPIGRSFDDTWPAGEGFKGSGLLLPVFDEGRELVLDRMVRAYPDGSMRCFDLHIKPLVWNNCPAALLVAWEVTALQEAQQQARQAAEEALERARELERSNRDLQDFAFIASHDLAEPLRKVQAFGERLKSRYSEQLSYQGSDWIDRMQNAAGRMQSMLTDLLSYSRISTRAQPCASLDLNVIAAQVISDLEIRIETSDGKVQVDPLPVIEADSLQIQQLFQNLISNGLKFSRPGVAPEIKISAQVDEQGNTQLFFKDNGIGLDMTYAGRIFEPFQRLHGRGEYEGNGMGLAICRKIVERHKGSITVESIEGTGSTFIVSLPARQGTKHD